MIDFTTFEFESTEQLYPMEYQDILSVLRHEINMVIEDGRFDIADSAVIDEILSHFSDVYYGPLTQIRDEIMATGMVPEGFTVRHNPENKDYYREHLEMIRL